MYMCRSHLCSETRARIVVQGHVSTHSQELDSIPKSIDVLQQDLVNLSLLPVLKIDKRESISMIAQVLHEMLLLVDVSICGPVAEQIIKDRNEPSCHKIPFEVNRNMNYGGLNPRAWHNVRLTR